MKTLKAEIPDQLFRQMDSFKQGWFRDQADIINQALRRFVDSHRPELMEKYILEDVEWALRGKE
jgi:hypothetical protein